MESHISQKTSEMWDTRRKDSLNDGHGFICCGEARCWVGPGFSPDINPANDDGL